MYYICNMGNSKQELLDKLSTNINQSLNVGLITKINKALKRNNKVIRPTEILGKQYYVTVDACDCGRIKQDGSLDMRYSMTVMDIANQRILLHARKGNQWRWVAMELSE